MIYILILLNLPVNIRDDVAIFLIFSDTSVLGLIFVGALVLLENQQGVLRSMSVTPLKLNNYLFSKVLSMTLLSSVVSSMIWILPLWSFKGFAPLLTGVVLSSIIFTMFGLGFAAGADSFNQYLVRVVLGSLIFTIPVIPMFLLPNTIWLIFLPMNAVMDLFFSVLKGTFSYIQLLDLIILIIWIYIMNKFAHRQFHKHNLFI